jgi:mono/diheme cytochrome c family protein
MHYPFWDVGIGYGMLMGSIAVLHVFISHFAIGGGLYLVIAETSARKAGDTLKLEFLKKLSGFFVMASVVMGALTGVGIWFIIGLLNPAATEMLIHHFVWGWAIEWTFFVIEILAALLYFYGWDRLSAKAHQTVGWIYFVSAWLSLVVITGIITFMLTPGDWLSTGSFWDGFFNPTYVSSVVLRTGVCVMLAGIYALLVASRYPASNEKAKLVRYNTVWALVGMAIIAPSTFWYLSDIPATLRETAEAMIPIAATALDYICWFATALIIVLVLFGILLSKRFTFVVGLLVMVLGIGWFGAYEWYRESVRKPFVVTDYMYANAVTLNELETLQTDGMLPSIAWKTGDDGKDLFLHSCRSCHTFDGYKALKPHYDGTDVEFIAGTIRGAHMMKGNMPEFAGTFEEADILAGFIASQVDSRPLSEIYGLSGLELGKKAYDVRCGKCHVFGGFNDKSASLLDIEATDIGDILDMAGDFADEMPPYTGDETERAALIEYIMSLNEGGAQ